MADGLESMGIVVGEPLLRIWDSFIVALPQVIAAILILILGYLLGALVAHLVKKALEKTKVVSTIVKQIGLEEEIGKWDIIGFLGLITKWYIFIVFLNPAAEVVGLTVLSQFFLDAAFWIPNIILAIVIAMAGYVLAEYIAKKIKQTRSKSNSFMATIAKLITIVIVVLIALRQIGIQISFAENAFLIVLAGIMLFIAIAFGLGFKDDAKGIIKDLMKRL